MAAAKPEIYFSSCFLRKTNAVHLLLGYKIYFTGQIHVFGVEKLMAPSKRLLRPYFETGNDKFKMAAAKTGCTCISAYIQDSKEIPMTNLMFSGFENSMALLGRLYLETGSQIFKMALAKPEVPVSQLLYKIAKKFQRLTPCFRGRATQWCYRKRSTSKSEVKNSRWRLPKPDVPLSQLLHKIAKKFQRLTPCFRGRETQWHYLFALS
jgi:hypothetical protein